MVYPPRRHLYILYVKDVWVLDSRAFFLSNLICDQQVEGKFVYILIINREYFNTHSDCDQANFSAIK